MSDSITPITKIRLTYSTIKNPFKVILDKLGFYKGAEILHTSQKGIKFYSRSGTTDINEAIAILSGLEYPEKIIKNNKSKNPIVIDAGAHIGLFSLFIKNLKPSAQIFAIEPLKQNLKILTKNLAVNSIKDIKILNAALSDKNGKVNIILPSKTDFDAANIVSKSKLYYKKHIVRSLTLGQLVNENNLDEVDLLKLDIEGAEYSIIIHDINTIKSKIKNLLIEYHKEEEVEKITAILQNNGFRKVYEYRHILGFNNTKL